MANVQKTIEIIFAGTDKLSGTVKSIGTSIDSFGQGISDIGQPFADAAKQVLILDAAIVGLGVAGLKASADLDKQAQKMANSLGLPIKEAEKFATVAKEVYTAGYGDDLAQAFEVVTLAQKKFGDNAAVDIGKVTTQSLKLQEVFGTDYTETLGAVNSLMKNFGITSDEAFNFVTAGFQKGLNGSGDFLDSITEYGVQFNNGEADAGQFFSVLETGFLDGIAGTDKAADAFKEFRVRIQDDSKGTKEALSAIGIDNAELQASLNSGQITVADAFQKINQAIQNTNDKGVAFRAGVSLIGTQFEDLGQEAAFNLDLTKTKIEDLQGSIDGINTSSIGKDFETLYRTITTSIADNDTWDAAKAKLSGVFRDITESFKEEFKKIDLSELENKIGDIWDGIAQVFKDANLDLTTKEGLENAIKDVVESLKTLADVTKGILDILLPLGKAFVDIARFVNDMDSSSKTLIGNVIGLGTALAALGGVVSSGGTLISGIGAVISGPAGLVALAGAAGAALGSLARLIPGVDSAAKSFAEWTDIGFNWSGEQSRAFDEGVGSAIPQLLKLREQLKLSSGEFEDATQSSEDFKNALKLVQDTPTTKIGVDFFLGEEFGKFYDENVQKQIEGLTKEEIKLKFAPYLTDEGVFEDFSAWIDENAPTPKIGVDFFLGEEFGKFYDENVQKQIEGLTNEEIKLKFAPYLTEEGVFEDFSAWIDETHGVTVDPVINRDPFDERWKKLKEEERLAELKFYVGEEEFAKLSKGVVSDADKLQKKVEDEAEKRRQDALKRYEIETGVALQQIKSQADVLQSALQFKAGVDIAEIEAGAQKIEAISNSISESTKGAASVLSSIFGGLEGRDTSFATDRIIDEQVQIQKDALAIQKELAEAEIALNEAKRKQVESGTAVIQVEAAGLTPALEMIWQEVVAYSQVRANEEGLDLLL